MITARNYAAQAERALIDWANNAKSKSPKNSRDSMLVKSLADKISESIHFSLPDNGELFEDNLKGISGVNIRLPYPQITIEYYTTYKEDTYSDRTPLYAPKHLVYANELKQEDFKRHYGNNIYWKKKDFDCDYVIVVFSAQGVNKNWLPGTAGWVMPSSWDNTEGTINIDPLVKNHKNSDPHVTGFPLVLCPTSIDAFVEKLGEAEMLKELAHNISGEVTAVLALCEALTCTNVGTEIIQKVSDKKNIHRIRDNKLPIYETRVLTIDAPINVAIKTNTSNGKHRSPRHHLRRGHIRVLKSKKRIWVNSCSVGAKNTSIIDKEYKLRFGSL